MSGIEPRSVRVERSDTPPACSGDVQCAIAIATYKGSGKKFFEAISQQLDIPTEATDDNGKTKPLTMDGLKEEIAQNVNEDTLLIFPEVKRLTTGIRYWLEDLIDSGVKVVCLAAIDLSRGETADDGDSVLAGGLD